MSESCALSSVRPPPTARVSGTTSFSLTPPLYRQFVMNNYLDIKGKNPNTPFIVRECLNAQPTVMARYDYGVEKRIYVPNLEERDVDQVVKELIEQAREVNAAIPDNRAA